MYRSLADYVDLNWDADAKIKSDFGIHTERKVKVIAGETADTHRRERSVLHTYMAMVWILRAHLLLVKKTDMMMKKQKKTYEKKNIDPKTQCSTWSRI